MRVIVLPLRHVACGDVETLCDKAELPRVSAKISACNRHAECAERAVNVRRWRWWWGWWSRWSGWCHARWRRSRHSSRAHTDDTPSSLDGLEVVSCARVASLRPLSLARPGGVPVKRYARLPRTAQSLARLPRRSLWMVDIGDRTAEGNSDEPSHNFGNCEHSLSDKSKRRDVVHGSNVHANMSQECPSYHQLVVCEHEPWQEWPCKSVHRVISW
jgi:hypothetical protein